MLLGLPLTEAALRRRRRQRRRTALIVKIQDEIFERMRSGVPLIVDMGWTFHGDALDGKIAKKVLRDGATMGCTQPDLGTGEASAVLVRDSVCLEAGVVDRNRVCVDLTILAALNEDDVPFRAMPNKELNGDGEVQQSVQQSVLTNLLSQASPWASATSMDVNVIGTEVSAGSSLAVGKVLRDGATMGCTQPDLGTGEASAVSVRDSVCLEAGVVGRNCACVDLAILAALNEDDVPFRAMPNKDLYGDGEVQQVVQQSVLTNLLSQASPWASATSMDVNVIGTEVSTGSSLAVGKVLRDGATLGCTQPDLGTGEASAVLVRDSVCLEAGAVDRNRACVDLTILAALNEDDVPFRAMLNKELNGDGEVQQSVLTNLLKLAVRPLAADLGGQVRPLVGDPLVVQVRPLADDLADAHFRPLADDPAEAQVRPLAGDLRDEYAHCECTESDPVVLSYREQVADVSNQTCLAKSPSKGKGGKVLQQKVDGLKKLSQSDPLVHIPGVTKLIERNMAIPTKKGGTSMLQLEGAANLAEACGAFVEALMPNSAAASRTTALGFETAGGVMTKLIERNTAIPTKKGGTSMLQLEGAANLAEACGAFVEASMPNSAAASRITAALGFETAGGVMTKLIERNTAIPTKKGGTSMLQLEGAANLAEASGAFVEASMPNSADASRITALGFETAGGVMTKLMECNMTILAEQDQAFATDAESRLHASRMQCAAAAVEALAGLRATVGHRGVCRRMASQAARDVLLEAERLGHPKASLDIIIGWL